MPALPNPFLQFAGRAEHAPANGAAVSLGQACEAAASFNSPLDAAMPGETAAAPCLTVSTVAAADPFDPEPLPLFLTEPFPDMEAELAAMLRVIFGIHNAPGLA